MLRPPFWTGAAHIVGFGPILARSIDPCRWPSAFHRAPQPCAGGRDTHRKSLVHVEIDADVGLTAAPPCWGS